MKKKSHSNTDVILVIDRSGSMQSIKIAMESAIKEFFNSQRDLPGRCTVSALLFDDTFSWEVKNRDISDIGGLIIEPRNMTALYDAIGQAIAYGDESAYKNKTDKTIVVIITDGLENASKKYNVGGIKELITAKQSVGWKFMFFGSNQDAVLSAKTIGIDLNDVLTYRANDKGTRFIGGIMGQSVSAYRSGEGYIMSATDRKNAMGE